MARMAMIEIPRMDEDNDFEGNIHADDDGDGQESVYSNGREGEDRTGRVMEARRRLRPLLRLSRLGRWTISRPGRWTRTGAPSWWGDTVMCYATKQKDKYDKRKAKVERLNTSQAVITMHEGLD